MLGARFALSFTFSAEVLFQLSNFRMSTFVRHLRCPCVVNARFGA